tara:strand:+ start:920 stop:1540 length:621 start_codon:yes stop_codon:yes gene_type:complete
MIMADKKTKPDFDQDLFKLLHDVNNPYNSDKNPHFNSKFAGLGSCLKTIKPALKENNFALQQIVKQLESGGAVLQTNLIHLSGKVVCDGGIPLVSKDANDPQKLGGSITYARRYGMCAILGIVGDDDDDGNLSSKPDTSPKALERLQKDFVQTIHESADKPMLDDLYTSYKEEISALKNEDQKWFRNEYKKQITFMKEKENKNADS